MQAEQPVTLNLGEAEYLEGPAGVAYAVKTLWANVGAYAYALINYVFSGGEEPSSNPDNETRISGRDLIALLVTLGIDLGLFVLMALNPPLVPANRATGLAAPVSKLKPPSGAVVRQLASAIATAVARAPGADLEWVRRHFVHHRGASYFVIPNLYSCSDDHGEELKALAMNQLAGVFENVALVCALTEEEAQKFGEEEERPSSTDLARYQHRIGPDGLQQESEGALRNHGLLSKSQRALGIAGWSDKAKRDPEIYRLVDVEGLTPLLTLLSEANLNPTPTGSRTPKASQGPREEPEIRHDTPVTQEPPVLSIAPPSIPSPLVAPPKALPPPKEDSDPT